MTTVDVGLIEPLPFSSREFAADTLPTVRAASLFAGADQTTLERWLRELAATPEGLTAITDIMRSIKAVSRRFAQIVDMLDTTSERLNITLEVTGIVKAA